MLLPLGSPAGSDVVWLNQSGAADQREEPWRLIVYKTVPGAFAGATEDEDATASVPRSVVQELKKKFLPTS